MPALREYLSRLVHDESGAIAVWVTVGMLAFFATGALLVDGGRVFNLHSQMQAYADHAALAAAAELDGDGQAIGRAINAVSSGGAGPIVGDTQNFVVDAMGLPVGLTVQTLTFLSKLGSGTGAAGTVNGDVVLYTHTVGDAPAFTAAQSQQARFVQVTVAPQTLNYVLAPVLSLLGTASASATIQAAAIAGFTRAACRFPPMMICNPTETNPGDPFNWESMVGKQVLMKAKGNGSAWAPGDFGLLDLSGYETGGSCSGDGANLIRCVLGLVDPGTQCILQGGEVDIQPGEAVSTHVGLNIRFDLWDPPLQNKRSDPNFAPARNVIKGMTHVANQCRLNELTEENAPSVALPQDAGLSNDNRVGGGATLAQLQNYWTTNHPTVGWPFPAGETPTRYAIYRKEIELNTAMNGSESMGPTCAAPVSEPANLKPVHDRRVLLIAVINCKEHNIQGSANDVPVEDFALMFLTEPIGLGGASVDDVYGEMIGIVKPNTSSGVLHEFPILYR
jgi:Flp pilus assembly protein TadG